MSEEVLLMENTSAGDLVELLNFDRSMQCFGSLGAFCCAKLRVQTNSVNSFKKVASVLTNAC